MADGKNSDIDRNDNTNEQGKRRKETTNTPTVNKGEKTKENEAMTHKNGEETDQQNATNEAKLAQQNEAKRAQQKEAKRAQQNEAKAQQNEAQAQQNEAKAHKSPEAETDHRMTTAHTKAKELDTTQTSEEGSESAMSEKAEQSETDNESNTLTPSHESSALDDSQEQIILNQTTDSEQEETRKSRRHKKLVNYSDLNKGKTPSTTTTTTQEGKPKREEKMFKSQIDLLKEMNRTCQREQKELKEEKTKLREENWELRENKTKLTKENQELKEVNKKLHAEINQLRHLLNTQAEDIRKRNNLTKEVRDKYLKEMSNTEKLEEEIAEKGREIEKLKKDVETQKRKQKELKNEQETLTREKERIDEELASHKERLTEELISQQNNMQQDNNLREKLEESERKLKNKEEENREAIARYKALETQLEETQTTLAETQSMIDTLLDNQMIGEKTTVIEERTPPKKPKCLLIADSNGRQIKEFLDHDNTSWTTTDDIFTLPHLLKKLEDREGVKKWKYEEVYISLGTNDVKNKNGTMETAKRVQEALRIMGKYTKARAYYVQPPPLGSTIENTEMAILQRIIIKKIPDQYISNDLKSHPKGKTLREDGVHITEFSAKAIAATIEERRANREQKQKDTKGEDAEAEIELNPKTAKYVIKRRRLGLNEIESETNTKITIKTNENDPRCVLSIIGSRDNITKARQELQKREDDSISYANKKEREIKEKQRREMELKEQVCEYYKRGSCRYGDKCMKSHSSERRADREPLSPRRPRNRSSSSESNSPNRKRRYNVY